MKKIIGFVSLLLVMVLLNLFGIISDAVATCSLNVYNCCELEDPFNPGTCASGGTGPELTCSGDTKSACENPSDCILWVEDNGCTWVVPTSTPIPTPTPPSGNAWCGDCDAGTCAERAWAECGSLGYSIAGCTGNCSAVPTPPPLCSGITYNLTPASPENPSSAVNVDIGRAGATSCSGNWNNVGLKLDGVPQGLLLCYVDGTNCAQGYHSAINSGNAGSHSLQFTVNSGSCTCNTETFCTKPFAPTNVTCTLNALETQATLSWNAIGGSILDYPLRINEDGVRYIFEPEDNGMVTSTSYTFATTPGRSYAGRMQARSSCGAWSNSTNFTCQEPASCSIDLINDFSVSAGETQLFAPSFFPPPVGGTITSVSFGLSDSTALSVCDSNSASCPQGQDNYTDSEPAFNTDITAFAPVGASATLTVQATMDTGDTCSNSATVSVANIAGWWQAKGADLVAKGGNIFSDIPSSCLPPSCDPVLVRDTDGYPGIPLASADILTGSGGGSISSTNWGVERTGYTSKKTFDWQFFNSKLNSVITDNWYSIPFASINNPDALKLISTYQDSKGYKWVYRKGDLAINASQDLSDQKLIIFIDGNLTINDKINFAASGKGFLLAIVNGNITVNPSVGTDYSLDDDTTPDLEGIYMATGTFDTGTSGTSSDKRLHLKGTIAASNATLRRDLPDNSETPGTLMEFSPSLYLSFPKNISLRRLIWKEVAP